MPCIASIDRLLARDECAALMRRAERSGFRVARLKEEGRDNEEALFEFPVLGDDIERRLRSRGIDIRLDDLIEVYRYGRGEHIDAHRDAGRPIRNQQRSDATLLIYLSDAFEGGRTVFPELARSIVPVAGSAIVFSHGLLHAAESVSSGAKYVARVDAAWRAPRATHSSSISAYWRT